MRFFCGVCGYSRLQHVMSTLVYDKGMTDEPLVRKVDAPQLRWFGHGEQISNYRLIKFVYERTRL